MPHFNQHSLPDVCTYDAKDCLLDFQLRYQLRKCYPGACSLEYQNVMNIVIECLLNWDIKNQRSRGPGIIGHVNAFAAGDEERGRGSLHGHWQIWVTELLQHVRDGLFHHDPIVREETRSYFYKYIGHMMCANYGTDLVIMHKCLTNDNKTDMEEQPQMQSTANLFENVMFKL